MIASCKNDDDIPKNPVDSLPPATQIGAQTFGCLVDGKVFLPKNFGLGRLNVFYQSIGSWYSFNISASNRNGEDFLGVSIGGIEIPALNNQTYVLTEDESGNIYGGYTQSIDFYTTSNTSKGILTITKHDTQNFILSGTFEFTVLDNDGKEIKITDGRFDVKYTN